jgi:hypothetical protein
MPKIRMRKMSAIPATTEGILEYMLNGIFMPPLIPKECVMDQKEMLKR